MRKEVVVFIWLVILFVCINTGQEVAAGALGACKPHGDGCKDKGGRCAGVGGTCVCTTYDPSGGGGCVSCTCQGGPCSWNDMLPRFQRPSAFSRRGKLGRVFEHIRSAQSPMENEITKRQNGLSDASDSENDISWAKKSLTLEVGPEKNKVKTVFRFANKGQSDVRVDSVRATCGGCSKAELPEKVEYQPGERGHVAVTVEFPRWERTVTRGIWVTFRRPGGERFMEHLTVKLKRAGQPPERQTAFLD